MRSSCCFCCLGLLHPYRFFCLLDLRLRELCQILNFQYMFLSFLNILQFLLYERFCCVTGNKNFNHFYVLVVTLNFSILKFPFSPFVLFVLNSSFSNMNIMTTEFYLFCIFLLLIVHAFIFNLSESLPLKILDVFLIYSIELYFAILGDMRYIWFQFHIALHTHIYI